MLQEQRRGSQGSLLELVVSEVGGWWGGRLSPITGTGGGGGELEATAAAFGPFVFRAGPAPVGVPGDDATAILPPGEAGGGQTWIDNKVGCIILIRCPFAFIRFPIIPTIS